MFKYISYTPFTDEYTTHEFNELNDKCKVHRFDVPYVSVEYEKEADFTALMKAQNKNISAVEITREAFFDMVQYSDQYKRMRDVANEQYQKEMKGISEKYTAEERDTWSSQVAEAKKVKEGTSDATPYVSALSVSDGITLNEAADIILGNKTTYDDYAAGALSRKWDTFNELTAEVGL